MDWKYIVCLGYFLTAITSIAAHDWIAKLTAALPPIVVAAAAATGDEVRLEKQGCTYAVPVWINRAITLKFVLGVYGGMNENFVLVAGRSRWQADSV
jgi:hypothetical protein